MDLSFFTVDGDALHPTPVAQSLWAKDQMHGVAISGALARGMEAAMTREDLRPARWSVDLFRPANMTSATVETTVLREGSRLCLVESRFVQEEQVRARATAVWLLPTEEPDGTVWQPSDLPTPPPTDVVPPMSGPAIPWYRSEVGWSQDFKAHQNSGRHQNWTYPVPVVSGEEPTPFQAVASIADSTSMVCNWSDRGVQYINTDISLSLARLPRSAEIGLRAEHWTGHDGIAVGVCTVHDREGVLGHSMVTSLTNARRTVDFDQHDFDAEGNRASRV